MPPLGGSYDPAVMLSGYPIFVVLLAAVAAPLIAQTRLGSRLPVVVFEVVLGILIGPQVLKLVADQGFLAAMREVGMVAVMFMAGMEIDFARIRGRPLALGAAGWLASLAVGAAAVLVLQPLLGLSLPGMLIIALVTTGLGTLLPILRDGGLLASPFGALLLAAATIGEVGPIVAASLVLSTRFSLWQEFALLAAFLGMVALAVAVGAGLRPPGLLALLGRTMHTSTQLPVRLALLLLATLIFLSQRFGFEAAIGAFAAGMIVGVAARGPDGEDFRRKIDAVCFGWFAPFFFVGTGVAFDVAALGRDLQTMLLVPTFLALFLLTRGLPAWLYRRDLPRGELAPLALSSAVASLGIVVVVANVGLKSGHLSSDIAQALIGAALLSLLVYPTAARALLARARGSAGATRANPDSA
ncbi:MAG TPA: cation:proton antiporter [Burkholderiaceae bacterium]|nr:cation:proton antiporter [Burkholderiaceae bacterium]